MVLDKTYGFDDIVSENYAFVTLYRTQYINDREYTATYKAFGDENDYRLQSISYNKHV